MLQQVVGQRYLVGNGLGIQRNRKFEIERIEMYLEKNIFIVGNSIRKIILKEIGFLKQWNRIIICYDTVKRIY